MDAFKGIGVLVFLYTFYCLFTGGVFTRDPGGSGGVTVYKEDEPGQYWTIIVLYFVVSIACFFFF